ncbi:E3 ubiquitin-protein ligase arih2 [Maudiozyma exigua]|uniref:E3 ubiquitin-protein ligase arih2 n=1 Tax=Maudiozyma exigua TaxID=34358 RepID=A0A9P6WFE3_MAUEX|nr:E3 ubiquitin-protein ligase arih2 [Kazachstania exigua]
MTEESTTSNDLASRILERAQMAQMARQLKLGLSQIPKSPSKDGKTSVKAMDSTIKFSNKRSADSNPLEKKSSPLKKQTQIPISTRIYNDKENTVQDPTSPSTSNMNSPMKVPSTPGRSTNHINSHKFLTTPNQRILKKGNFSSSNNNGGNDDTGADLLMYLATSPYTKTSSQSKLNNLMKIPTTPSSNSYMNHGSQSHSGDNNNHNTNHNADEENDAIRLSAMKPSLSSPQSTFKVPQLVSHNNNSTLSYADVLMESPSLYMTSMNSTNNGISPQKKRINSQNQDSQSHNVIPHIAEPTTPSRDSSRTTNNGDKITQSKASNEDNSIHKNSGNGTNNQRDNLSSQSGNNSNNNSNSNANNFNNLNLLKTPNFNMGDYIHNLFSPSPNISTVQVSQLSNSTLNRNSGLMNDSASDAFNGLIAASAAKSQSQSQQQQQQQQSITATTSASSLMGGQNNGI